MYLNTVVTCVQFSAKKVWETEERQRKIQAVLGENILGMKLLVSNIQIYNGGFIQEIKDYFQFFIYPTWKTFCHVLNLSNRDTCTAFTLHLLLLIFCQAVLVSARCLLSGERGENKNGPKYSLYELSKNVMCQSTNMTMKFFCLLQIDRDCSSSAQCIHALLIKSDADRLRTAA